ASMGRIEVQMEIAKDGRVSVVITADNKDTLTILQRDSHHLENALQSAGMDLDPGSMNFNLRGGETGEQKSQQAAAADNVDELQKAAPEDALLDDLLSGNSSNAQGQTHRIDIRA
ncbi:MAG: flagellar hook-length control protein FliK, partial [Rhodospirillales bacterium]|nr:flagellar hook-length control protein FliK [Rhodospirillales bacterium]